MLPMVAASVASPSGWALSSRSLWRSGHHLGLGWRSARWQLTSQGSPAQAETENQIVRRAC